MKFKKTAIILSILSVMFSFFSLSGIAEQKNKKKEKEEKIYIPNEVKSLIEEGLAARQSYLDIPFEIVRFLYLPAQQNVHAVFMLKIKNADLDFKPLIPNAIEEKTKNEKSAELQKNKESQLESSQPIQADFKFFAQIYEKKEGKVGTVVRESYAPASFREESSSFKPEEENIYSIGMPFPPGDYLLALAITSPDLSKIGLQYFEFSLPDSLSFQDKLGMTPVFFIESLKQHEQPEILTQVHKNSFVFSTLEIFPKMQNIFSPGEPLDIFYYIYGCKPDPETNQYNIEIQYQVKKGEESIVKFKEKSFSFPLISHPLPVLKSDNQPPEPSLYVLEISINDKISGHSFTENIEFEIR